MDDVITFNWQKSISTTLQNWSFLPFAGTGELLTGDLDSWVNNLGPAHQYGDCISLYIYFANYLETTGFDSLFPYVCEFH